MTIISIGRRLAALASLAVVGFSGAGFSQLTPSASAHPPLRCAEIEQQLLEVEAAIRDAQWTISHLAAGGVTGDEVVFMDRAIQRLGALEDQKMYLRNLMYSCFKFQKYPVHR